MKKKVSNSIWRGAFFAILLASAAVLTASAQPRRSPLRELTELPKPVVKPATNITANGFTANWEPVDQAVGYGVTVYTRDVAPADGVYALVDEDFSGIDFGSIVEPVWGEDLYEELDDYTTSAGWSVFGYGSYIAGMVGGLLYTPYVDLSHDGGHFTITVYACATDGDTIRVDSHGEETVSKKFCCKSGDGGVYVFECPIEFDNGCKGCFLSMINETAEMGQPDYVDRVVITQRLRKDEEVYTMVAINDAVDAENDWGEPVSSVSFFGFPFAQGATDLYYDVSATAYDYSRPRGSLSYTAVFSPYSDMVHVNLAERTSELVSGIRAVEASPVGRGARYDLQGRRLPDGLQPARGVYIEDGRKVVRP